MMKTLLEPLKKDIKTHFVHPPDVATPDTDKIVTEKLKLMI